MIHPAVRPRRAFSKAFSVSEDVCDHLFRAAKDGILLVNEQTGTISEGNPALRRLLGLAKTDLVKKKVWRLGFVDGPLANRASFGKMDRDRKDTDEKFRLRTQRGRLLEVRLSFVFYRSGDVDVIQITVHDATEQQHLQNILQERELRYQKLFDNSLLGIAILSLDSRVVAVNRAFSDITGYDEHELKGLRLTAITHPAHLAEDRKIMRNIGRPGSEDHHVEKRFIGKGGNVIWGNTHFSAVCDASGKPLYLQATIEDITDRKHAEAELAEYNLRLIEKEKAIERLKDEFIFIAAHELRAPVTAISWATESLRESQDAKGDSKSAEMMTIVEESAKRLKSLVSELLEVSRMEYGTFKVATEKFALPEVISRTVAAMGPTASEKSVTVTVEPAPPRLPLAIGDPARTSEIVTNLLTNAIKYNRRDGHVTISIRAEGGELWVSVQDDGLGLAPEDLPKLFQRFTRLETAETKKIAGTGLGLFIVKQVVERMGGHVWATSAGPGKGSMFTFTLPKAGGKVRRPRR